MTNGLFGVDLADIDHSPKKPRNDGGFKSVVYTLLVSGLGLAGKVWVDISSLDGRLIKLETMNVVISREVEGTREDIKDLSRAIQDARMGYRK
jgi:hypothetical protein